MQKIAKYLDYIIYYSLIILPFSVSVAPAFTSTFVGFLISSFVFKKIIRREKLFINTAINLPFMFLFLLSVISFKNTINYSDSFRGMIRLVQNAFVFLICAEEIKDEKHIGRIFLSVISGASLASFDAIWQVLTGKDFIRGYAPVINLGMVRATASFKDSNVLGIYLSAVAPLLFGPALYHCKKKKKIAMFLASLIALAGILLTYSRPTLLAIYMALFFLSLVRQDKKLIAFLVILVLIAPFILPRAVKDWAREVEYNPLRFMCNDDRIAVYRNSLNMIKDHPFIGLGVNTYMKNYKKYKEPVEYRNVVTKDYMYAHNNFIHMAAETGLIGFGFFLWLLYKLFTECKNIYRKLNDDYMKIASLSLSACLIAFLVNGLTESSLYYSRVAIIFWYITGFALSLKKFAHAD